MACDTIAQQLAAALGKDTVNTTDQIAVVENSTLYRVTIGDLAVSLGLTGALTNLATGSVALVTGTAPNYEVRGVRGANGISAQLNTDNNVTISQNIANAGNIANGTPIIKNTTGTQIAFKRIKAGGGIEITSEANSVVITNSQVASGDSQLVIISSEEDFPAPVGGIITLADNTTYELVTNVVTSSRFVYGAGTTITSTDVFSVNLTYTGVATMFTFVDGNAGIKDIALSCPNGTLFDASGVTSGTLLLRYVRFTAVNNLGQLGHSNTAINNTFVVSHTGAGWFFNGNVTAGRLNINSLTFSSTTDPTATIIDLDTSTFEAFSITNVSFLSSTSGQTFLAGLTAGGNITAGEIGYVSRVTIEGDMAMLGTISPDDAGWNFSNNNKVSNTFPIALTSLTAPVNTTIGTVNTPVVLNGVFADDLSSLFTISASGRCTYNGRRDINADVTVSISGDAAATTKTYTFYVAKNGVVEADSAITREFSTGSVGTICLVWALVLAPTDYVEVFVENNTDTTAFATDTAVIRVKG